jgi:hypothetical protein
MRNARLGSGRKSRGQGSGVRRPEIESTLKRAKWRNKVSEDQTDPLFYFGNRSDRLHELDFLYAEFLRAGFIELRMALNSKDWEWIEAVYEVLHNVPSLIGETNVKRHEYFLRGERPYSQSGLLHQAVRRYSPRCLHITNRSGIKWNLLFLARRANRCRHGGRTSIPCVHG